MVWKQDFVGKDGTEVYTDNDRFLVLKPFTDGRQWIIRIGVKSNSNQNQEAIYKNRSRAMIQVKNLLKSKSWKYQP